jgi:DNA-binding winged helix-turn-helix (wHTH) protein/tetratricopeptide (TPR) repeat protein
MIRELIKFGEFELDAAGFHLQRSGRTVKLERIPLEVLILLVERPGDLVTREEIVAKFWGNAFLDTENAVNTAVRKIRQALEDSPEQPRFIQTVSGKGYRFIAPVDKPVAAEQQQPPADRGLAATTHDELKSGTRLAWQWKVAAAGVAAVAIVFLFYSYLHRSPKLTDKDTIVVADFANITGDPVFDRTLRQGLAVQLEQSPFLSLISEERIRQTLRLMGQQPHAPLTPEFAREICERTASTAVLEGAIASLGSEYVLSLRATNCRTGDILDDEQVQTARKEDVLTALGQIANKFRARAGESLASVKQHDTPLPEATTSSLEALKAYSAAWQAQATGGSSAAIPHFKRAIEIDPKFALAYAALGRMYDDLGESELSAENTTKAYELRDRVSDREKFFIGASYDLEVTGKFLAAEQTCNLWSQTYPRDPIPHAFLSGDVYPTIGNYKKAVEEASQAIALDPDFVVGYWNLAYAYEYLGELGEAENALRRAAERKLKIPDFFVQRYDIAFLKGDKTAMQQAVASAEGKSVAEEWISDHEALVLAYGGQLRNSRAFTHRAEELANEANQREEAALFEAGAALREAFFANAPVAVGRATAALGLSKNKDVQYGAAFSFALAGDNSMAEMLANDLEKRFPEDISVRFSYIPSIRALLALNKRKPAKALELLEVSAPYELGAPHSSMHGFFGALCPVYVRGMAYLAAHHGREAAAELQKILDHPGVVVSDPIGALAHLQLARAYVMSGDRTRAKSAYQDFLKLWKDADPEIPIFKQANAEYAKLS